MDKKNCILIGFVCLIYSCIANFQLTLSIILAIIILLITLAKVMDDGNNKFDNKDEAIAALKEMEDMIWVLFVCVTSFIMWIIVFNECLIVI